MMSKLTVDEWVQKIGAARASNDISNAQAAATAILEELRLYGQGAQHDSHLEIVREDMNTLANALNAYAKLLFQLRVKP